MPLPKIAMVAIAIALSIPALAVPSERAQFRSHAAAAKTHFGLGEFREAAAEWRSAYEIRNVPVLLFDMAQAFRLAHDWESAREDYRNYLRALPDAPNKAEVMNRIRTMTRSMHHPPKGR